MCFGLQTKNWWGQQQPKEKLREERNMHLLKIKIDLLPVITGNDSECVAVVLVW